MIACAMEYPDNHDLRVSNQIVEGVMALMGNPQSFCHLRARRAGEGDMAQSFKPPFEAFNKAAGGFLGCLLRDEGPDFGQVGFGTVG